MQKTKYSIYLPVILVSYLFLSNCANRDSNNNSNYSDNLKIENNKVKVSIEKQKEKVSELERLVGDLNSKVEYQESMLNTLSEELNDQVEMVSRYNSSNSEVTSTLIKMKNKFEVLEDRAFYTDSVYFEIVNDLVKIDSKIQNLSRGDEVKISDNEISDQEYLNRYNKAFDLFINHNDLDNSLNEFLKLISLNRDNALADNCQYWIGEVYYKQGLFEQSIFEFEKVFNFTDSNKLDDAQYKIILCHMNLGDKDAFLSQIDRLKNSFPNSEYIGRANNLINKFIKEEG